MPLEDYQQRVVTELADNEDRREKLDAFRRSQAFLMLDREDQVLLNRQSVCMEGLSEVLTDRIKRFKLKQGN